MITAVDTNVLLDILGVDPKFGEASAKAMRTCLAEGALVVCTIVWAETATAFANRAAFARAMDDLSVTFDSISQEAALDAAEVWRRYRARGGLRTRIAGDFLIGAHAKSAADRLLTRDRGFFGRHFSGLKVMDPSKR
ncbi:MAG: type II toxin-antitoxin system VapC family toxin [Candidatus Binataceae bacterium]